MRQIATKNGNRGWTADTSFVILGIERKLMLAFLTGTASPLVLFIPATFFTIALAIKHRPDWREIWRDSWPILGLQIALLVVLVLAASRWAASRPLNGPVTPNRIGIIAHRSVALASVLVDILWIARLRKYRWLALSASSLHLCLVALFYFATAIAVTGDAP